MRLTKDLKGMGYSIIRGYERRKKRYLDVREAIESGSGAFPVPHNSVRIRSGESGNPTVDSALALYDLYNSRDVVLVRAVDDALEYAARGFEGAEKDKLVTAMLKNAVDGRRYPLQIFSLCISSSAFYRRRDEFLFKTLENAGYINRLFLD